MKSCAFICVVVLFMMLLTSCMGEPQHISQGSVLSDVSVDAEVSPAPEISVCESNVSISESDYDEISDVDESLNESNNGSIATSGNSADVSYTSGIDTSSIDESTQEESSTSPETSATSEPDVSTPVESTIYSGLRVAYVPLDDRPVNVDRVLYLAESAGIELLMPDIDLFSTRLDGLGVTSSGLTHGDRAALMDWLEDIDESCDYFVISLDQLLSGGLVGSRSMTNTDLSFERDIIRRLSNLAGKNTVYLFDTVMRLASTVGYQGYTQQEYDRLRQYGAVARAELTGTSLTIEAIVKGYPFDEQGSRIPTSLTDDQLDRYFSSRERKLHLAEYVLKDAVLKNCYMYIGVDDSCPKTTIQTNEISFLKRLLGENGTISAGTDELGMISFTRLVTDLIPTAEDKVKVSVTYFGGAQNQAADAYDTGTLHENVLLHLKSINCVFTDNAADLSVLVLTRPVAASQMGTYIDRLIQTANNNIKNRIPTVILDVAPSDYSYELEKRLVNEVEISKLLGYSSWNTAANALGIAISQGVTRYCYLEYETQKSVNADSGFIRSLAFAFVKDISYKGFAASGAGKYAWDKEGLTEYMLGGGYQMNATYVLDKLSDGEYIADLSEYSTALMPHISAHDFILPWRRTFEMRFEMSLEIKG